MNEFKREQIINYYLKDTPDSEQVKVDPENPIENNFIRIAKLIIKHSLRFTYIHIFPVINQSKSISLCDNDQKTNEHNQKRKP